MKKVVGYSILLVILANLIYFLGPSIMRNPDSLFVYFYMHNVNLNIVFTVLFIMFYSLAVIDDYFRVKNSKFDRICILRIGYMKYYLKCIREIIVKSIVFKVSFECMFLISLFLLIGNFNWEYDPIFIPHTLVFCDSLFMNIVWYIVTSTIGLSIFGIFIFSIIDYINNLYVFRILPILLTIISVVILSIIASFLSPVFYSISNNLTFINTIIYSPSLINLIEPGSIWEGYGFLSIFLTGTFYILLILLVLVCTTRRRNTYG